MKNYLPRTIFEQEHDMFRETCRDYVDTYVRPNVDRWHEQGYCDRDMYKKAGELGLLCVGSDEKFGGGGIPDWRFNAVFIEELAQSGSGSVVVGLSTINDLVAPYLDRFANDEQKERFLKPLAAGDYIGALAMTEPGAGADLAGIRSYAAKDENGDFILNGSKTFISNGMQADFTIIAVVTDPSAGRAGVSLMIIEDGMEGYTKNGPLKKVGLKAQDTAELNFENVRIPKENLLGEEGAGFAYLRTNLAQERLSIAVGSVASTRRIFDLAYQHSLDRQTFGKPLIGHQNQRFVLAEMVSKAQVAQSFVDQCILARTQGILDEMTASMAKWWTTDLQIEAVNAGVQTFGGYGFMLEYEIATHYLDSRVQPIYGGPNEIMKEIIGRKLMKGE